MKFVINAAIAMAVIGTSCAAFAKDGITFSPDMRTAYAAPGSTGKGMVHYIRKPASATIFSNLASKYKKGLYFSGEGSTVYGSATGSQWVGSGFTPAASATAMEVDVAVGNFGDGHDQFELSINADSNGTPGAALATTELTVTNAFGVCCGLAIAKFPSGVALTGGTPYWVTVTLTKKQTKANDDGAWMLATTDQVDTAPAAYDPNDTGWVSYQTPLPPAFGVFSK